MKIEMIPYHSLPKPWDKGRFLGLITLITITWGKNAIITVATIVVTGKKKK